MGRPAAPDMQALGHHQHTDRRQSLRQGECFQIRQILPIPDGPCNRSGHLGRALRGEGDFADRAHLLRLGRRVTRGQTRAILFVTATALQARLPAVYIDLYLTVATCLTFLSSGARTCHTTVKSPTAPTGARPSRGGRAPLPISIRCSSQPTPSSASLAAGTSQWTPSITGCSGSRYRKNRRSMACPG